jgi:hypothetical protein
MGKSAGNTVSWTVKYLLRKLQEVILLPVSAILQNHPVTLSN